jgi:hypothetical protein
MTKTFYPLSNWDAQMKGEWYTWSLEQNGNSWHAVSSDGNRKLLTTNEVGEWCWHNRDELEKQIAPELKKIFDGWKMQANPQ